MTLYAVRPDPNTGEPFEDAEVVAKLEYGWDFLDHASMLLRLVDVPRAEQLDAVMIRLNEQAEDHGELRIYADDMRELVRLVDGIEHSIVATGIVDKHWRVPCDRLDELAKVVPAMDLKTERSLDDKTHALAEVMANAISIRNFLKDALAAKCVVILG